MKLRDFRNARWTNAEHTHMTADCVWERGNILLHNGNFIPCGLVSDGDLDYIHLAFATIAASGNVAEYEPTVKTRAEIETEVKSLISQKLTKVATDWGYSSFLEAISYAASSKLQWSSEATALLAWRDSLEIAAVAALETGTNVEEIIATLPLTEPGRPQ